MAFNPAKPQKKMPRMSRALFEFGGPGRNLPGSEDTEPYFLLAP